MIENTNLELKLVEIRDNQYMSDLYPDGLPSNAIIDKTLTAKGKLRPVNWMKDMPNVTP